MNKNHIRIWGAEGNWEKDEVYSMKGTVLDSRERIAERREDVCSTYPREVCKIKNGLV